MKAEKKETLPSDKDGRVSNMDSYAPYAEWYKLGECSPFFVSDPDFFFEAVNEFVAKAICMTCPVLQQCRNWAIANDIRYGVWGGLSAKERLDFSLNQVRAIQARSRFSAARPKPYPEQIERKAG